MTHDSLRTEADDLIDEAALEIGRRDVSQPDLRLALRAILAFVLENSDIEAGGVPAITARALASAIAGIERPQ